MGNKKNLQRTIISDAFFRNNRPLFARNSGSAANRLQLNSAKGELFGAVSAAIRTARSGLAQGSFYTARESESEPAVFSCLTRFLPSSASPWENACQNCSLLIRKQRSCTAAPVSFSALDEHLERKSPITRSWDIAL